jgi:hypothetical protein
VIPDIETDETIPATETSKASSLLALRISVPHHVVYRSFPTETVMLNLQTGKYFGLNTTAGRVLEELQRAACARDAAAALAESYDQPLERLEHDVCELCRLLLERGLAEVDGASPT